MKLVTKYQIPVINSCWEKCDEKCAYMFNVYKNQLSRQTGSRNLTVPKTLPTIWHTYLKLVTKYQISAIDSCWEKCDEKYLGRTDRSKTAYTPPSPPGSGGIIIKNVIKITKQHELKTIVATNKKAMISESYRFSSQQFHCSSHRCRTRSINPP